MLSRVPYPLEKGDKLRAYHLIKELSHEHEVNLFCLSDTAVHSDAESKLKEFCSEVYIHRLSGIGRIFRLMMGFFNSKPFQVSYFYSKNAQRVFNRFVEQHIPQHISCQLVRTAEYALPFSTIPKSIDYMDALSVGMNRMADKANWPMSSIMKTEYRKLRKYELDILDQFDVRFIISEQDKELLSLPAELHVLPNGVDPKFFEASNTTKTRDILFTGNMSYRPNVESARFLVNNVMPLVWKQLPQVKVTLAGANPASGVNSLKSSQVEVTGWVDDIKSVYDSSRVFVAPMLINSGLQNKLLEAMACGVPSLTTPLANNALGAQPESQIMIGDDAESIAAQIVVLLTNTEKSATIASQGKAYVEGNFSWEKEAERLLQWIG